METELHNERKGESEMTRGRSFNPSKGLQKYKHSPYSPIPDVDPSHTPFQWSPKTDLILMFNNTGLK